MDFIVFTQCTFNYSTIVVIKTFPKHGVLLLQARNRNVIRFSRFQWDFRLCVIFNIDNDFVFGSVR